MRQAHKFVRRQGLLKLLLAGASVKQCAEALGVSRRTVERYVSEPRFTDSLYSLAQSICMENKSLRERLEEDCRRALDRLVKLLKSEHEGIALKAADSILDRCPETARNRRIAGDMHARYSIDPVTLAHAAAVARELDASRLPEGRLFERDATDDSRNEGSE